MGREECDENEENRGNNRMGVCGGNPRGDEVVDEIRVEMVQYHTEGNTSMDWWVGWLLGRF